MYTSRPTIVFLLLGLFLPCTIFAQSPYKVKTSKMHVEGTSSLHDWVSEATQLEWVGSFLVQDKKIVAVKDVQVKIPVKSIKSTKGSIMDNKTYDAFHADKNPTIVFKLSAVRITQAGTDFTLESTGTLQMAGTTRTVSMNVTARLSPNGDIQLVGSKKLNMKEFGMEPPTAVMGTIKVGPEVTLQFDLKLTHAYPES